MAAAAGAGLATSDGEALSEDWLINFSRLTLDPKPIGMGGFAQV